MLRKKKRPVDDDVLPVGLWEYLQPYVAEEAPPSLEWSVRRPLDTDEADDRSTRLRVVPAPAPAS